VKFYFQTDDADVSNADAVPKQASVAALSGPGIGDETIMARIADVYPTLSRAHRRAADFVLKHPFQAATMMIDELARAAGISVATANRFARALGIDGYPAFRAELVRTFSATLAPVEKLRAELRRSADCAEIMRGSLTQNLRNLQTTVQHFASVNAERAVAKILAADRVFTIGFGTSGALANFAAHALSPYCRFVQNAAGEGGAEQAVRRLLRLGPRDAVIGIALPRYSKDTVELLHFARERGATVIAITDGPASPLAKPADIVFCVGAEHALLTSSGVGAFALIEAMGAAVARQTKDPLDAATEFTERVLPYLYVGSTEATAPRLIRSRAKPAAHGERSPRLTAADKGKRK
jgi:DNA-binding MurR/RpiR family transcriptional regulator